MVKKYKNLSGNHWISRFLIDFRVLDDFSDVEESGANPFWATGVLGSQKGSQGFSKIISKISNWPIFQVLILNSAISGEFH